MGQNAHCNRIVLCDQQKRREKIGRKIPIKIRWPFIFVQQMVIRLEIHMLLFIKIQWIGQNLKFTANCRWVGSFISLYLSLYFDARNVKLNVCLKLHYSVFCVQPMLVKCLQNSNVSYCGNIVRLSFSLSIYVR